MRVRLAIVTKDLTRNGITMVIMNYAKRLPLNLFEIAVFFNGKSDQSVLSELSENGIGVVELPSKTEGAFHHFISLANGLRVFNPNIVHINGSSALMASELLAACCSKAKIRIAHTHSSSCPHPTLNALLRPAARLLSTNKLACSSRAGNYVFASGTFDILPNAFEVERFSFNGDTRRSIRKMYNIPERAFVLGNVGRVNDVKNQRFCVDVFNEVCRWNSNSYLMFVGDGGAGMDALRAKVVTSPNKDKIILTGDQRDTAPFYSAFDALLFPSLYEGLGITVLEAQASGLHCFISSVIPKEVEAGGNITRIELTECAETWAKSILENTASADSKGLRVQAANIETYDIGRCCKSLAEYYLALHRSASGQAKYIRLAKK